MIVDYKKFNKGATTQPTGLLTILEQMPGYIQYMDRTDFLNDQTYWPSYNIPALPLIQKGKENSKTPNDSSFEVI